MHIGHIQYQPATATAAIDLFRPVILISQICSIYQVFNSDQGIQSSEVPEIFII